MRSMPVSSSLGDAGGTLSGDGAPNGFGLPLPDEEFHDDIRISSYPSKWSRWRVDQLPVWTRSLVANLFLCKIKSGNRFTAPQFL